MRITAKLLRKYGAKCKQLEIFNSEWPKGTEVTLAACLRAAELKLDFRWAAERLFSYAAREIYKKAEAPAREVFDKIENSAREAYCRAESRAWGASEKISDDETYCRAKHRAWRALEKAKKSAWKAYTKVVAAAFCEAAKSTMRRC